MNLVRVMLEETSKGLRNGALDLQTYITNTCKRMRQVEPIVHALVPEKNYETRLFHEADRLTRTYPIDDFRPGLFGVLVGIKDLYHVDGFPTHAGSNFPSTVLNGNQSSLVSKILELGAIILGKTAMDEFAYAAPSPTRNPYNVMHTPGGSSSGSAAAVATGISPLCIGTQTSRSVIAPASFCGIVGFKPTYGRVPLDGIVFMSHSLDTAGFFTQDVEGMRIASNLLVPDWTASNRSKRPVLGIPEGTYMTYMSEEMNETFYQQVNNLKQWGYAVQSVEMPWDNANAIDDIYTTAMTLLHGEMYRIHERWFVEHKSLYRGVTIQGIELGKQVTDQELDSCKSSQHTLRRDINEWMDEYGIDVWISPSQGATAPKGDFPTGWGGMTTPWSLAGMPCVSLPAGTLNSLPYGIQAIARCNDDESLILWAAELEAALQS
ncbi:MAG: amidase [Firmicutes bacterium]|nr:amidase [Bacillota bacterium]